MFSKIISIALLVAYANAIPIESHQPAGSLSGYQNTIHHIHSAPTKTVQVPTHTPTVSVQQPQHQTLSSGFDSSPFHHYTITPVQTKAAPSNAASSFSSLSFGQLASLGGHDTVSYQLTPSVHSAPAVHAAPAVGTSSHHQEEYAHPKYEFAYGVEDHHTGDIHSHKESRDGDKTQGEYSLHEADGTIRTVKYTVDKHSGFNAIVERKGHATHAQPAKTNGYNQH